MVNAKGGKGYKKGKNDDSEAQVLECNAAENQMYGRTMKSLGNRRFRIFCNDNKERICRVCGSMRKSQWVEQGSIVLISIRDLSIAGGAAEGSLGEIDIGDIIGLVDPRVFGKMKKLEGINPLLFTNVETRDPALLKKSIKAQEDGVEEVDDFFTHGSDAEDDDDLENIERKEKKKVKELEISAARNTKYHDTGADLDIDNI
jgi:initiation factor 1A